MAELTLSRVDKFLAGLGSKGAARGNLVFALDATASRERTWDTACQLTCSWSIFAGRKGPVVNARPRAGSITPRTLPRS